MHIPPLNALIALAVVIATAATDAVYVRFTSAVVARRRLSAANWSGLWYLLSSFAVISYTNNWAYVCFAAIGSAAALHAKAPCIRHQRFFAATLWEWAAGRSAAMLPGETSPGALDRV
jgi:hypothetical protein